MRTVTLHCPDLQIIQQHLLRMPIVGWQSSRSHHHRNQSLCLRQRQCKCQFLLPFC
uniref:Uncharacterized protein n=1 Tax=Amphimedon queenslandica TaxID=400682 RepID=A0A1X7V3D1_AMPQE